MSVCLSSSPVRSLVGQSSLLREAQLFKMGLSLIRSLMGHPPLLREAHMLETRHAVSDRMFPSISYTVFIQP